MKWCLRKQGDPALPEGSRRAVDKERESVEFGRDRRQETAPEALLSTGFPVWQLDSARSDA
jgi:hypothetical protein